MQKKLNKIFDSNAGGFGVYDKDAIISEILALFSTAQRDMLLSFCDKVIWGENRIHVTTEKIDKFLNNVSANKTSIEELVWNKKFPDETFDADSFYDWAAENAKEAFDLCLEITQNIVFKHNK